MLVGWDAGVYCSPSTSLVTLISVIDLVVWDSHPLALGATPKQVFIDGIPQLSDPHPVYPHKPASFQVKPRVPNFDKEAKEAVEYEGLPPLEPEESLSGQVAFINVRTVFGRDEKKSGVVELFRAPVEDVANDGAGVVLVQAGAIKCIGSETACLSPAISTTANIRVIDTEGGSIAPGLVTFGAPIGLQEIEQEQSTNDGSVYDPLVDGLPDIFGDEEGDGVGVLIRAVDGLQFGTRNAL